MKVTISDIAKLSGVSKATVSRVINGSKPVSSEVRDKVMKVIDETGFKPSALARSLSTKRTKLIGVVIPDVANPVFSELVKGMEDQSNASGYNILLCNTYLSHEKELQYLDILQDKEVDGIIFLTTDETSEQVEFFKKYGKPVVTVDRKFKQMEIPSVGIDDFEASYKSVNYLINMNHKEIAMVRAPLDDQSHGYQRYLGYTRAMEEHNLDVDSEWVVEGDFTVQAGYNAMMKLLSASKPPSAVFFASDLMAVGGIRCITDNGMKVPDDVSVIGFDDIPIASMFIPSLTTTRQPTADIGMKAMEKLLKLIGGEKEELHSVFPTELILRNSTKKRV